ncbi:MAG: glycosyltransferase [Candidatus Delongbacteria bacterium]|nr:glycosyltransferase [Candidatus Delongbacteria bacterium]
MLKNTAGDESIENHLLILSKKNDFKSVGDLGIKSTIVEKDQLGFIKLLFEIQRKIREINPDIIHSWAGNVSVYISIFKLFNKFKFVNGMITSAPREIKVFSKNWIFSRFSYLFSDIILGNSKAGLKAFKAPTKKSEFIHNGFDFKRLTNLRSHEEVRSFLNIETKYVVCMVAAFSIFKDYKTYIKAANFVLSKFPNVTFLCVGAGEKDPYRSMVNDPNEKKIIFIEKTKNIEDVMNVCDIGILATYTEGISNSIMEYMALGKPVVASGGGGIKEIISNGNSGYILKQGDHTGMGKRIIELLRDPDKLKSFGNESKDIIEKNFTIDKMVIKTVNLYKRILQH